MNRRDFLKLATKTSLGLLATTALPSVISPWHNTRVWAVPPKGNTYPVQRNHRNTRLLVVFLRGAADGLSIVIPCGDRAYYDNRPHIYIPAPNEKSPLNLASALPLDQYFALNPSLEDMYPYWQSGQLGFVHACGSPNDTRSHFDAQDYMESGTPGSKSTGDGWLNRLAREMGATSASTCVNIGTNVPRILSGKFPVMNVDAGEQVQYNALTKDPTLKAFDALYNGKDELSQAYFEAKAASKELLADYQDELKMANNGGLAAHSFAGVMSKLARLMKKNANMRIAFTSLGGWDTHIEQGSSKGKLARELKFLGTGLTTFAEEMGEQFQHTQVIVLSEFGRTFKENGNGGTDHGHGNVMWLFGNAVQGGRVYGQWPGLAPGQLYQNRDLAITTDFRDVLAPVLGNLFSLNSTQLSHIFPQYAFKPTPIAVKALV